MRDGQIYCSKESDENKSSINRWSRKLTEKFFEKLINYFLNSSDFESFMIIDLEISLNFCYNGQVV